MYDYRTVLAALVALSLLLGACSSGDSAPDLEASPVATAERDTPAPVASPTQGPRAIHEVETGNDEVDATLNAFPFVDEVLDRVHLVTTPCSDSPARGPVCTDDAGEAIPAFFWAGSTGAAFYTSKDDVEAALDRKFHSHAAWTLYSVSRVQPEDLGPAAEGYVAGWRVATGNSGMVWYLDAQGMLVGLRELVLFLDERPKQGVDYLCGPSYTTACYRIEN